jgi:hypothetical protein
MEEASPGRLGSDWPTSDVGQRLLSTRTNDQGQHESMKVATMKLSKAFTLLEPGPVVLVTTRDGRKANVMTISWTMVVDFTPRFAITTGAWNYS